MSRNIVYIINPIAGTRTKKDLQELIERKTGAENISYQIFPSVASGDYSFLSDFIREEKVTDVAIAGGDGTINQVVKSLHKTKVNFGIIPCGSGNGLAYTARIPKQPAKALDVLFAGKASLVDAFMINDHFACMLCGLGFDAKVAHDFAQQPKRGLTTYVKQALKNFISARTYSFEVQTSKNSWKLDAYFISVANSNQFGNNFKIAPQASLSDGKLDIVIMASRNKLGVVMQTLKQISGLNSLQHKWQVDAKKGLLYFRAEKLTILNKSAAPLHIDGDPAETADRFSIEIKKNFFSLIQGV